MENNQNKFVSTEKRNEYIRKKQEVEKIEKINEPPKKKYYRPRAHVNVLSDTMFPQ